MTASPRHLYVHVPFCARRCSYCDFSIAVRRVVPSDAFVKEISAELAIRYGQASDWELDTLYFGGGTPSSLGSHGLTALIAVLQERARLASGAEVTVEANPEDVNPESAGAWLQAGINRVSLGVQSFDDSVLGWMHRVHDAARAVAAVRELRTAGVRNLSVDLIFGLPETLERSWRRDLDTVLELKPDHVSLYGLTVEPHTPLARWIDRGDVRGPLEERYADEFTEAHDRLTAAGYHHYEVSNFALPGSESRHNSAYWMGYPYGGLGPAAHAFDGVARRWNEPYAAWRNSITRAADPVAGQELLTPENRRVERVYLGLRTTLGVRLTKQQVAAAGPWVTAGWADLSESDNLTLTPAGWLRLDELTAILTASDDSC